MIKVIIFFLLLPLALTAHEGHNKPANAAIASTTNFSSEATSAKYEVLIKYKTIPVGKEGTFQLFLSDYITNKPVDPSVLQATVSGYADVKLTIVKTDTGVFEVKGIFPEKKKYNISVSINSALGPDLLLVKDIESGKEPDVTEVEEAHSHWYSSNWFYGILGILAGMSVMFLLMKRNRKVIVPVIIFILLMPASAKNYTIAHGGEDHGTAKKGTMGSSTTFLVEKETQFLFDILTQKVITGNFNESTEVLGTILPSPKGKAVIQSPQAGKIVSIRTSVGQRVKAGQVVAVIEQQVDAGTQVSIITQKNAVDAEYNAAKAQYDRLSAIADIVAKKDLTEAKARFETAEKNRRLFNANATGNIRSTKMISLTAPISGIVGPFSYSMGAVVGEGQTLFEVTNLDKVFVEAQVFTKLVNLKNIQKITAISNTGDTSEFHLKVISEAQEVNADNQAQKVLFELSNANGRFKIGENVNVRIYSNSMSKAVIIPDASIADVGGKPAVFIKDHAEQYSISYVNKGTSNGKQVNILQGVEDGERVVTAGIYQMKTIFLNQ